MSSNHLKNVAITGGGGQIGSHIVQALLASGKHDITALTRKGSKNVIPEGVKSAFIDYDDHASIVEALKGQEVLIISMSVTAPTDTTEKLLRAAADAKIGWIIPNAWGTDVETASTEGALKESWNAQKSLLNSLNLKWIGIACSMWYEFSLAGGPDRYGFDLPNKSLILFDNGETKIHTSSWPNVGRTVAALLSLPISADGGQSAPGTLSSFEGQFVHVASFYINQKDMLASVLRVSGTKESDWKITNEPLKERYASAKTAVMGGDFMAFGRMLYSGCFFPNGPCDFTRYGLDNEMLGLPKDDLDEFTKKAWEMAHSDYFEKQYGDFEAKGGNQSARETYDQK